MLPDTMTYRIAGRTGMGLLIGLALLCGAWLGLRTPSVAAQRTDPPVHIVQAGDTLSAIAARYGVTVADLVSANQLANPDQLAIGQRLLIPGALTRPNVVRPDLSPLLRYVVEPGDTLAGIAHRWQLDTETLRRANSLSRTHQRLIPGQEVLVPLTQARSRAALADLGLAALAVVQGQAGRLDLRVPATGTVRASYDTASLAMVYEDGRAWGLFGVHPLTPPGTAWLNVDVAAAAVPRGLAAAVEQGWLRLRVPLVVTPGAYITQHIVLPPSKGELLQPERLAAERAKLNAIWPQASLAPQWTGVFTRPLALEFPVTSPFGTRRSYNGGPVSSYHEGQDFGVPEGIAVLAPAPGRVVLAEELAVRGNAVIIDHGAGLHTGYWHLSKIDVQPGQMVRPGDQLGEVGTTGLSTGWHLHWEARIGTIPVDPMPLLQQVLR